MTANWLAGLQAATIALLLLVILRDRRNLRRLYRWAIKSANAPVPDATGQWGEAFSALHRRARLAADQQRQLHDALDRFRQAAEAMPDGVAILNAKFAIEWMNERAEELLEIDMARDVGTPIVNLVREPDFIAYLQDGVYAAPRTLRLTRRPKQTLQVHAIAHGENRLMLLLRDISQIERLEAMRRDFVANVSHELKTPLTVVSGFIESLIDEWPNLNVDEARQYLGLANEQAMRMRRLIDDLLTLAALDADPPLVEELIEMSGLIADLRADAIAISAGRHTIDSTATGPSVLNGNRRELQSALGNLVNNAICYTPTGGQIEIIWQAADDGSGVFKVRDNGVGIEPAQIPRLTERFYRIDRGRSRDTGGTGLGLAIVKHILERHGGSLEIASTPGQGSCFSVRIPPARVRPTNH